LRPGEDVEAGCKEMFNGRSENHVQPGAEASAVVGWAQWSALPPLRPGKYCRNRQLKDDADCRKVAYGSARRGTMLQH